MEKKRWSMIFMALCLILASSVSPVEAGAEDTARKCSDGKDNDRNGFIDCNDNECVVGGFCSPTTTTTTLKVHLEGAFVFRNNNWNEVALEVFLNPKGNIARSDDDVRMTRPEPSVVDAGLGLDCSNYEPNPEAQTWHEVFCTCGKLLSKSPPDFFVGEDDWLLTNFI